MSEPQDRAQYETELSRARRSLMHAQGLADRLNDYGASEDLLALCMHLTTLMDSSLRSKRRPQRTAQLDLEEQLRQLGGSSAESSSAVSGKGHAPLTPTLSRAAQLRQDGHDGRCHCQLVRGHHRDKRLVCQGG